MQGDDQVLVEQWREAVQAAELAERLTTLAADSGDLVGGGSSDAVVELASRAGEASERAAMAARQVSAGPHRRG